MDQNALTKFKNEILSITKYDSIKYSEKNSISFSGSPIQHPYDNEKFILICDPISDHTEFLEFSKTDVVKIEDLTSITTSKGESIRLIKVWIKEGVVALKYQPFIVGKTNIIVDKIKKTAE
ncbi:MAG: hypothetical protein JXB50_07155 [Spirochaetes bacterium]|nr:hypothetical protein [Spirochaetota bacterium]